MTRTNERQVWQDVAQVESQLTAEVRDLVRLSALTAASLGVPIYIVGGFVRDLLLGRAVGDLDLAVCGDAIRLAHEVATNSGARVTVHERFGTATLKVSTAQSLDIVTTRKETYASPGALPKVEPGNINDDLVRRDFTVNAIALEIRGDRYALVDPLAGSQDIASRIIRILHERSFKDDPTRIFRAVKFAHRLDFLIEKNTLELILRAIRDDAFSMVSRERLSRELLLILEEPNAGKMLADLERLGVLRALHPQLSWPYEADRVLLDPKNALDRSERKRAHLAAMGAEYAPDASLAAQIAAELHLGKTDTSVLATSARLAALWPLLGSQNLTRSQLYNLLRSLDVRAIEAFAKILPRRNDHVAHSRLMLYLNELRHVKTSVTGEDLKSLGLEEGPLYRDVLQGLLAVVMEGEPLTRDEQLKIARSLAGLPD